MIIVETTVVAKPLRIIRKPDVAISGIKNAIESRKHCSGRISNVNNCGNRLGFLNVYGPRSVTAAGPPSPSRIYQRSSYCLGAGRHLIVGDLSNVRIYNIVISICLFLICRQNARYSLRDRITNSAICRAILVRQLFRIRSKTNVEWFTRMEQNVKNRA